MARINKVNKLKKEIESRAFHIKDSAPLNTKADRVYRVYPLFMSANIEDQLRRDTK